jgi:hypothetical protein
MEIQSLSHSFGTTSERERNHSSKCKTGFIIIMYEGQRKFFRNSSMDVGFDIRTVVTEDCRLHGM